MYRVTFDARTTRTVRKFLLPERKRLLAGLKVLNQNPRPAGKKIKKLVNRGDSYRLRIGPWRVLYQIDDLAKLVTVYAIARRDKAYR